MVRHARAGDREDWKGDDRLRPLDDRGRVQADLLPQQLPVAEISRVLSSPYVRCMQTVEPLARVVGTEVEPDHGLVEGRSLRSFLDLLAALPQGSAVCGHGDMIGNLVLHLSERGVVTHELRWPKGSTWILDYREAQPSSAGYLPPPSEPQKT